MQSDTITGAAQGRLRSIIERIERLEEDKAAVAADIKEVFAEAKGEGFDVKILRKVVSIRKTDKVKRDEEEALLDLYMAALGMDGSQLDRQKARGQIAAPPPTPLEEAVARAKTSSIDIMVVELQLEEAIALVRSAGCSAYGRDALIRTLTGKLHVSGDTASGLLDLMRLRRVLSEPRGKAQQRYDVLPADQQINPPTEMDARLGFTPAEVVAERPPLKATVSFNGGPEADLSSPEGKAVIADFALSTMTGQQDAQYRQAVDFVRYDRKASTSYIQRKLQIGYNLAASFMERMEREGIVSPANHVGKRDILVA